MRDASIAIMREIGVETGGSNIQFAVDPKTGRLVVIEMNPRVSRSSALASKATGFPIAKIAAKLAVGYTLDELQNDITRETPASFEPTIDYCVVKIPRFAFEKFPDADRTLTTQMKSVGEMMAIGRTFKEALQKALRSLEIGRDGFGLTQERCRARRPDAGPGRSHGAHGRAERGPARERPARVPRRHRARGDRGDDGDRPLVPRQPAQLVESEQEIVAPDRSPRPSAPTTSATEAARLLGRQLAPRLEDDARRRARAAPASSGSSPSTSSSTRARPSSRRSRRTTTRPTRTRTTSSRRAGRAS